MGSVNISPGGVRANVMAGEALPTDTVWKYSSTVNRVELCGSGEEADGFCLSEVASGELLNDEGICYSRKTTGVFEEVTIDTNFTAGNEWMSSATGTVTAYVVSGDNRPLGKFLSTGLAAATGKISFYSK